MTDKAQHQHGPRILVVDDEAPIRRLLHVALTSHGFHVAEADSGQAALMECSPVPPDAVVLDLGLPDMDGQDVIRELRKWSQMPIIILSARQQDADKVKALDAGADDYVTKPFSTTELLARLRVAMRHSAAAGGGAVTSLTGGTSIDWQGHTVAKNGTPVHLTPVEHSVLAAICRRRGHVATHKQLLREVWGMGHDRDTHYLRIYVAQLRQKLEDDPENPRTILTEPGVGYRAVEAVEAAEAVESIGGAEATEEE